MIEKYPQDAVQMIQNVYSEMREKISRIRKRINRPLTLAEKILFAHWAEGKNGLPERGKRTELFKPDRVAMQDATAQMAILQFITAGLPKVAVPSTVHCDHLILAESGSNSDLASAQNKNREVYDFLQSASAKYGMGFWRPGAGIIHQVILENYAFPGGMMIGTDSHTPNAGGLGMIAVGVGGADAVDVMVGLSWEVLWPQLIGVRLIGKPSGWTSGKDVILRLAEILTVKGGTGKIVEYFGSGTSALSCTAKATITNMGAELGATTSVFPYDLRMESYLKATGREKIAALATEHISELTADPEALAEPEKYYDRIIEIDLSTLEPYVVGPHTPDLARPVSKLSSDAEKNDYPRRLSATLIGSCTNSSYEDIGRAAFVARQMISHGRKAKSPFFITPGSERIRATIVRDGFMKDLEDIGGILLANACGPCIGQWKRNDSAAGTKNSIMTSYNRNFPARNDGSASTLAFIASPEVVTAFALAGDITENPLKDGILLDNGERVKLIPPSAKELPPKGFADLEDNGYLPPAEDGSKVNLKIDPNSERLAALEPFTPIDKSKYVDLPVLLKAKGKCTTDHISPAGRWLRFRGHLDRISDNMFIGANNVFSSAPGSGKDAFSGEENVNLSELARRYKAKGMRWVVVGDENYGEGSSREHAAMSPRHLGCLVVIAKSFARIHETNLKKQGILALTFFDPKDYDKIKADDRLNFIDLNSIVPGSNVKVTICHSDGKSEDIICKHSFNEEQIKWFNAGSALNVITMKK
ncbi:MAG: aconitate hydratase [Candidatus Hydrogenedentes bacterium CG1_02_42_14]|nr:MAG: aconitate hydratase [Candidatus Hydrogenedentes bacterium CG1_02_42_14]